MPPQQNRLSLPLKTGLFVSLGLVVLALAIFVLGERQQLFSRRYEIHAMYDDVSGLQEGAFVRISGINVGTVSRIDIPDSANARVRVTFKIRGDASRLIRTDSKAIIDTEGLLGSRIVIITQGSATAPEVPEGGEILGQSPIQLHRFSQDIDRALEDLDDVVMNGAATLASLSSITAKIDQGHGSLGALLNRRTLHDSVVAAVSETRRLATSSRNLISALNRSQQQLTGASLEAIERYQVAADTLTATLSQISATGRSVSLATEDIRSGQGTLGRLMTDDSLYVALTRAVVTSDTMLHHATHAITEITGASRDIAHSARQARETMDQITGDVRAGRGTVGRLFTDDSLYVRLNRTMSNMEIATQKLAVNMEAIRTNWLFRSYFEDRGYWDNLERDVELNEQREYRLRQWEERLRELQMRLEARDRELQARERRLRQAPTPTPTETETSETQQ